MSQGSNVEVNTASGSFSDMVQVNSSAAEMQGAASEISDTEHKDQFADITDDVLAVFEDPSMLPGEPVSAFPPRNTTVSLFPEEIPHSAVVSAYIRRLATEIGAAGLVADPLMLRSVADDLDNGASTNLPRTLWLSGAKLTAAQAEEHKEALTKDTIQHLKATKRIDDFLNVVASSEEKNWDSLSYIVNSMDYRVWRDIHSFLPNESNPSAHACSEYNWLYLIACEGEPEAMLQIAKKLRSYHDRFAQKGCNGHSIERIALSWEQLALARSDSAYATSNDNFDRAREVISKNNIPLDKTETLNQWCKANRISLPEWGIYEVLQRTEVVKGVASKGTMIVLDEIGDAKSREGQNAVSLYSSMLAPIPLKGGAPEPGEVYKQLRAEMPWLDEANILAAEACAISRKSASGHFNMKPILMVGPPGVGKTRWARRFANIVDVVDRVIPFSGANSSVVINGVERGWHSGRPSSISTIIRDTNCANPIIVIDEVDKASDSRHNGNPVETLLPLLESETASRHFDSYLLGRLDLSAVTWVLTANSLAGLPDAFLDRVQIVNVGVPDLKHYPMIFDGILADFLKQYGISAADLEDTEELKGRMEKAFQESKSIRTLKKKTVAEIRKMFWRPDGPRLV